MKKKISIVLLLTVTLMLSLLSLTACGKNNEDKRVPVYHGMTITKSNSALSLTNGNYRSSEIMLLSANNDDNGNHYGHYKGDHSDRNNTVDEENPYPDNDTNENIEEEIKSSLNIIGSPDAIYYATPNEDIYINIHIDNPDSFEIMSFTLNGKKYSSYMFEKGSDMETIVLKYNVGNATGIVEYTIDAIKYIDGSEIKDVIIDGNKTVMAGIRTENQVVANVTDVDIDTNALSFSVNIKDNNSLVEFSKGALKAVIYDGFNIVSEKDIAIGDNIIAFEGLKTNTLYQYAIIGYYDDLSGNGLGINILYKDAFYTDSVVLFDNITVDQTGISFGYLWRENHQVKTVSALKLYKGDVFVKELSANDTTVSELLSDTTYKLVAEYLNADKTESIYLEFTTLAKAVPEISVHTPTQTQTSVGFTVTETDTDNIGALTKIELVHANGTVVADSLDQRTFTNLLSNNSYTVKVTYVYNLNDGTGDKIATKELDIKTDAKAVPTFEIKNTSITTESIDAEYDITDVDNILSSYKVELYKGENFLSENEEKNICFDSLDYYTDYTIKITYTYDLNDGNGIQKTVLEKSYKTLPFIDVIDCNIANTSSVSEGETIFMSVKLDNPLGMSIESVVINGETYNVTGASTKNSIFVEIVYNGQFFGGDTYLKIDKVNAKLDDAPFVVEPKTELSDNVFINGKLEVLKIEFVNEAFEPIDWAFPSEKVYVLITLDNPTGYSIDSVNTEIKDLKKLNDNKWYYEPSFDYHDWQTQSLNTIQYHNAYIQKTIAYSDIKSSIYITQSDTPVYIYSADDLKNMTDGYYYELKDNIDLSDVEWHTNDYFYGVFNGNGYSINNMSFVGTIKNTNAYLGLFKDGSGVIENLKIKNATIIADVVANDNNNYDAYCGAFISALSGGIVISSCSVDEYSTFSITNTTNASVHIGGFIGTCYSSNAIIKNSNSLASISGNCLFFNEAYAHYNVYTGGFIGSVSPDASAKFSNCTGVCTINGYYAGGYIGFVGDFAYVGDTQVYIYDSISSGKLEGEHVGGFIGFEHNNSAEYISDLVISNCLSNCSITANKIGGGIAGAILFPNISITNCITIGSMNPKSTETSIDYLVVEIGNEQNTTAIENCYSLKPADSDNCNFCTVDQLNSKEFYIGTLGWSEDVWDFSELDVESGKHPILKQQSVAN